MWPTPPSARVFVDYRSPCAGDVTPSGHRAPFGSNAAVCPAIGMTVASLLIAGGVVLFTVVGTSAGIALVILGFLGVVMTAQFTAVG